MRTRRAESRVVKVEDTYIPRSIGQRFHNILNILRGDDNVLSRHEATLQEALGLWASVALP